MLFRSELFFLGLFSLALSTSCTKTKKADDAAPVIGQDQDNDGVPDGEGQVVATTPSTELPAATAEEKEVLTTIGNGDPGKTIDTPTPRSVAGMWEIKNSGNEKYKSYLKFDSTQITATVYCLDKATQRFITNTASVTGSFDEKGITLNDELIATAASGATSCTRRIGKGTYTYSFAQTGELNLKINAANFVLIPSGSTDGRMSGTWQDIGSTNKVFWTFGESSVTQLVECEIRGTKVVASATSSVAYDKAVGHMRVLDNNEERKFVDEDACLAQIQKGSYPYSVSRNSVQLVYKDTESTLRPTRGMFTMKGSGDTVFYYIFGESSFIKIITCKDGAETFQATASANAKFSGTTFEILESKSVSVSSKSKKVSCISNFTKGVYSLNYTDATDGLLFDYKVTKWRLFKI